MSKYKKARKFKQKFKTELLRRAGNPAEFDFDWARIMQAYSDSENKETKNLLKKAHNLLLDIDEANPSTLDTYDKILLYAIEEHLSGKELFETQ